VIEARYAWTARFERELAAADALTRARWQIAGGELIARLEDDDVASHAGVEALPEAENLFSLDLGDDTLAVFSLEGPGRLLWRRLGDSSILDQPLLD
jgi:hypothetical protein